MVGAGGEVAGPARVFEKEETALQAILEGQIAKGDVLVIRYEGPQGGPGMREMLAVTSAIAGAGMIADVALITDGRFSGGSHGIVVGHMAPEAQAGGPVAAIEEGDIITCALCRGRSRRCCARSLGSPRAPQSERSPWRVSSP